MKKAIFYDKNSLGELHGLDKDIQKDFLAYVNILKMEGKLGFPEARKVTKNLFEIRVIRESSYRGFYAYVKKDYIVILHFFNKKTQKTPLKNIKVAQNRLKKYV